MTLWFAPALVALEDFSAVTAMKMSFVGCIRNVLPFLLYAAVNVILLVLSVTSLGLGALVVIPIMLSSTYVAYRDIYYT
ncbi:MAG: hypothetical protein MI754_07945 [Chromatiales bacterium]|nr:hypothetical protein [Chromatiales bacterium]